MKLILAPSFRLFCLCLFAILGNFCACSSLHFYHYSLYLSEASEIIGIKIWLLKLLTNTRDFKLHWYLMLTQLKWFLHHPHKIPCSPAVSWKTWDGIAFDQCLLESLLKLRYGPIRNTSDFSIILWIWASVKPDMSMVVRPGYLIKFSFSKKRGWESISAQEPSK